MVYKIVIASKAKRDLRGIQRYIALDAPQVALRFCEKILSKQETLGVHPEIGRAVPEFSNRSIREIIIGNYRLIYKADSHSSLLACCLRNSR
jgi:addiction module RelE/StbE family toxin